MPGRGELVEPAPGLAHREAQQRHRPDDHLHARVLQLLGACAARPCRTRSCSRGPARRPPRRRPRTRRGRSAPRGRSRRRPRRRAPSARSTATSKPSTARTSVRAMTRKSGSRRPSTAARTRLTRRVEVDDLLAVEVAAALGVDLVLDVEAGEPRVLHRLHGAGDVHRLAEARVGVDERRQVGHPRDLPGPGRDLGQRREADVGQSEVGGDDGARDVDALEALLLDQPRAERVERAGQAHEPVARERLAEARRASRPGSVVEYSIRTARPARPRRPGRGRRPGA